MDQDTLLGRLRALDWNDLDQLAADVTPLLEELATDKAWLANAMDTLLDDPHLAPMCERLAELDKLVLLDDPLSKARIRMHVFRQGYFDRPHNHRFWFATRILTGAYRHTIYGDFPDVTPDIDVHSITPKIIKFERAGAGYVIGDTLVHSVAAVTNTVTLTVRGPARKDRMIIIDQQAGRAWWVFGAQYEDNAEIEQRILGRDRLAEIRVMLEDQGLLG
jgi:hypothetical protein